MEAPTDSKAGEGISIISTTLSVSRPTRFFRLSHLPTIDLLILIGLTVVALIPRLVLAGQLDIVTDEIIYIIGGKTDLHLTLHGLIGAAGWNYNYEHPPLVKLLIGLAIAGNAQFGYLISELRVARLPSSIFGTLLIATIYWLGRHPWGRVIALFAALSLAVSPWLVYFSALAYLDMTMTTLITLAYLLLWAAIQQPRLYILVAVLVGLATASKYTASLAIPGMLLFTFYYFFAIRPRLPLEKQPRIPWRWWIAAILLAPLIFLAADPAIWPDPTGLLLRSFQYEWEHSYQGHLTFLAGQYNLYAPHWAILYIILAKMSVFVTLPALFFVIFALMHLLRFHLSAADITPVQAKQAAGVSFLLIWLLAMLGMFSLLNIVVGTHYDLPVAPPIALAGAYGLTQLLRYRRGTHFAISKGTIRADQRAIPPPAVTTQRHAIKFQVTIAILAVALVVPHLIGLTTTYAADGYTSELFASENKVLQVAYPGYREAVQWLASNTRKPAKIGLVGLENALGTNTDGASWYRYNNGLPARFQLTEVHPTDRNFPYDYLIWPMHLVQRGYTIPASWKGRVVRTITGGNTIYCYILARNPSLT